MTRGDLQVRTRGDLTAILWGDKRDARILTNIHDPPAEGNFCDNNGKENKFKILKVRFYLGNRVLYIFQRTSEISLF